MHILDFIFRERYVPGQYSRPSSASPGTADADKCRSPPQAASTAPGPSGVPPYIQLFQPRVPVISQAATRQSKLADDHVQTSAKALPSDDALSAQSQDQKATQSPSESSLAPGSDVTTAWASGQHPPPPRSQAGEEAPAPPPTPPPLPPPPPPPTTSAIGDESSGPSASSAPLSLKDCRSRACVGVLDTFKRALRQPTPAGGAGGTEALAVAAADRAGDTAPAPASTAAAAMVLAAATAATSSTVAGADGDGGSIASADLCPPDTWQLGRATWTFLHSVAAHYPDQPSARQQELMRCMMEGLAEFYPCEVCAEHLREQVRRSPPRVGTARELNVWLCGIHNEVNSMLDKPLFDCNRLMERWRDGPPDGSCD